MFSWIVGYKSEANTPSGVKSEANTPSGVKSEENTPSGVKNPIEEEIKIGPPQKLERSTCQERSEYTARCQGNINDVIYWADYEKQIKEIREDLNKLKIESDERWNKRLSPVLTNREIGDSPKKKHKKKK